MIEIGAELEPLSRIAGNMVRGEKSSNDGGNFGAMLEKPISLEDTGRRS